MIPIRLKRLAVNTAVLSFALSMVIGGAADARYLLLLGGIETGGSSSIYA